MTTLETRLEIKSWDEKPYRELPDGTKFARAEVVLAGTAELTGGTFEALLYYRPDGTGTYTSLMSLTGTLDGRTGTLVLAGEGGYDGASARSESRVVDATGDLAGLTGTLTSVSTHADYPYMPLVLTYQLG
ncbi:MAG TPA: DUF3224 domain-containing protein [Rugosimonospora sp.]|nr:DUF3224 domain-containing protein [Rugosimonospora sp.]